MSYNPQKRFTVLKPVSTDTAGIRKELEDWTRELITTLSDELTSISRSIADIERKTQK